MENQKRISVGIAEDTSRLSVYSYNSVYENDFWFTTKKALFFHHTLQGIVVYKNKTLIVASPNWEDKREVQMEMLSSDPSGVFLLDQIGPQFLPLGIDFLSSLLLKKLHDKTIT